MEQLNVDHSLGRLRELQALPLDRKVGFTAARIAEFYQRLNGKVYVSFSGGKDSTVLLYIVRKLFPDVKAVYADTGLEYPEIRAFVKTFPNVVFVRPEMPFNKVLEKHGFPIISKAVAEIIKRYRNNPESYAAAYLGFKDWGKYKKGREIKQWAFLVDAPFKISDQCCDEMKKKPLNRFIRETGLFPIIGTMAEESFRRTVTWLQYGCNVFDKKIRSNPLSFWKEQDVLEYIHRMKIPISPIYGEVVRGDDGRFHTTGAKRTGCMFCMFGVHMEKQPNRFQRMFYTHPTQWKYCIEHLKLGEVLDFLNVPYTPEPDLFNWKDTQKQTTKTERKKP